MTNVAGILLANQAGVPSGMSASLGLHSRWAVNNRGYAQRSLVMGSPILKGNIPLATQQPVGRVVQGHGGDLFERIIVTERLKTIGFLLSTTIWDIEVWNTCKRLPHDLTGISITGVGGLQIDGPSAMVYYPWQSQIYVATLNTAGDLTIDTTVTWSFTGMTGADFRVTGSRIVVFPHSPDWSENWIETTSYLTSVLDSYAKSEQRRALREDPRYTATFQVMSTSPLETASLENLVYGRQTKLLGVPWWPESEPLLSDVAPGAQVLLVDTTHRLSFVDGGLLLVWADFANWEAFNVTSIVGTSIGIGSPTTKTWKAGTRVIPMRLGRIADQPLDRPTNWISSGKFSFLCEAI